jgi:intracellular septation protein
MTVEQAERPKQNPIIKLVLEMGPLALFFVVNAKYGIFPATAVLMAGVVAALIASWVLTKHIPVMPLVTAVAVVFFGSLTFFFHDELFIKLKPTIVNALFGAALLGGLAMGKPLLPIVLDSVMKLTETGWRVLTFRWGLYFWVSFKVFGTMPITILFALSQVPLILKHELKPEAEKTAEDHW